MLGRFAFRFGRAASLRPLSRAYGFDRGTPIDRFYIERFLAAHASDIRGSVLEIGDDNYSRRFKAGRVERQDVLHIDASNPAATIVGDLADPDVLPAGAFDCIILTQTLQYVFDLQQGVSHIRRALRPGGVALITAPAIAPLCDDEWKAGHYWLFTMTGLKRLLDAQFKSANVTVGAYGNLYAATAFLHGAAAEELSKHKLGTSDSHYPVTVVARAVA